MALLAESDGFNGILVLRGARRRSLSDGKYDRDASDARSGDGWISGGDCHVANGAGCRLAILPRAFKRRTQGLFFRSFCDKR